MKRGVECRCSKGKILPEKNEIVVKGDKNTMCMIICIFIHINIIISIKYVAIHDHDMFFLPKHRRQRAHCDVFVGGMVILKNCLVLNVLLM